jgi:hypothetical protein
MSVEETTNNIAPLRIDKFEFFKFVLNKIDITPTNFCVKNGWSLSAFKGWKQGGVPKRAWGVLEKEIKLINLTNFHRRYKEDVFFLQELQDEYIQIKETTN